MTVRTKNNQADEFIKQPRHIVPNPSDIAGSGQLADKILSITNLLVIEQLSQPSLDDNLTQVTGKTIKNTVGAYLSI
uniref:Transposase n=1 Tax=Ascaris lumbricoides TaxID=6252 RepID=A0A0M3HUN5_ASCLU